MILFSLAESCCLFEVEISINLCRFRRCRLVGLELPPVLTAALRTYQEALALPGLAEEHKGQSPLDASRKSGFL